MIFKLLIMALCVCCAASALATSSPPCNCEGRNTHCHPKTGECVCTTKGYTGDPGDHCNECDNDCNYFRNAPSDSCYYNMTIDTEYTFNLPEKNNSHYTGINLKISPPNSGIDADLEIYCTAPAKINITAKNANGQEKDLLLDQNCTSSVFKHRFSKFDYNFGVDEETQTTFLIYVHHFQPPIMITTSISQI